MLRGLWDKALTFFSGNAYTQEELLIYLKSLINFIEIMNSNEGVIEVLKIRQIFGKTSEPYQTVLKELFHPDGAINKESIFKIDARFANDLQQIGVARDRINQKELVMIDALEFCGMIELTQKLNADTLNSNDPETTDKLNQEKIKQIRALVWARLRDASFDQIKIILQNQLQCLNEEQQKKSQERPTR